MNRTQSLRKKFLNQIFMILIAIVLVSGIIQLFFIKQQMDSNVESQAKLVANNILEGISRTELAANSIENQIDLKMIGYAKYISSELKGKTLDQITTEDLMKLKEELGLQGITLFVEKDNDVIGVKATDPKEVGFSFKPFGVAVLNPIRDTLEGKRVPRATGDAYKKKNILVLPISQSGSHSNPTFFKYAYYHEKGTNYLINPYIKADQVYQFTKKVGPDSQIKEVLDTNSFVKEIAVLNPRVFKKPSLEKKLYSPLKKVEYGTFNYKTKKDINILKNMVSKPKKTSNTETINGKKLYKLFIPVDKNRVIYIAFDYMKMSTPLYRHSIILLITGVISLIVLFLLTARFFNRIYENIQKIKRQIQSLEKGDLTAKSNVNDRSELENLSQSTNRMVDKLNKLVKDTQEQATKTQKLSVLLEAETSQTIEKIYAMTTETTMKSREQLYEIISFLDELVETLQPYKKNEQVLHLIEKVEDMKQIANERTAATTDMTITLSDLIHSLHGQSRELSEISNALLESMKKFKL
ncbi:methyl-accepting chemotaxis protein [Bacillus smithii]|uniref:methyl-accepting chemotaxis protein n=2 Tax=Bacillus smithii TaxID=1479 RepID=UPI003D21DB43